MKTMLGPPNAHSGRGLMIFAAVLVVLALWMSLGNQQWLQAALFGSLAVMFGCYGAMLNDLFPRGQRVLLVVGLVAGVTAFVLALRSAGVF
jgi:Na+/H+ antiporter NhaD/arsenite permease-like protein